MPLEFEWRFSDFDKSDILERLNGLPPGLPQGSSDTMTTSSRALLVNTIYRLDAKPGLYVRIRTAIRVEERATTEESFLTSKINSSKFEDKFEDELETRVEDAEATKLILESFGFRKHYTIEKIRETFVVPGFGSLDFDEAPGLPQWLEVECETLPKLRKLCKALGLRFSPPSFTAADLYFRHYGVPLGRRGGADDGGILDLTFSSPSDVRDSIAKNRKLFDGLLKEQRAFSKKARKNGQKQGGQK